jgi:hypothetical protein
MQTGFPFPYPTVLKKKVHITVLILFFQNFLHMRIHN